MAIVSEGRSRLWPPHMVRVEGLIIIDALGEKAAFIFEAPASGSLTDVIWRSRAYTSGTFTLTVSLQGIDADGYPDGNIKSSGNAKVDIASSSLASMTTYITTLGTAYTATRGEKLALVFEITAFTSGALQITIATSIGEVATGYDQFPYLYSYLASTHSKAITGYPEMGVKIGAALYNCQATVPMSMSSVVGTIDSNPDEFGNVIIPLWGCQAEGVWIYHTNITDNFEIILYNSTGTALQTITVDKDYKKTSTTTGGEYYLFASAQTLTKDATYRLVVKPTASPAVSNNIGLSKLTYDNADVFSMLPGGSNIYGTQRQNGGAWTDLNSVGNTFARFTIGLILDGIDIPAGTGGGSGIIRSNLNRAGVIQ